jgi:hypothetical protein
MRFNFPPDEPKDRGGGTPTGFPPHKEAFFTITPKTPLQKAGEWAILLAGGAAALVALAWLVKWIDKMLP